MSYTFGWKSGAVRWLTAATLLASFASFGASSPRSYADIRAASLKRISLSGSPAALPAALAPLGEGAKADPARVNAASSSQAISGSSGQLNRIAVPLGDVSGDGVSDIVDARATAGTLTYRVISGANGQPVWTAPAISRPADILAAIFPAKINDGPMDFYLLEQHHKDAALNWTLHAVDGTNGTDIWTTNGSLPEGLPSLSIPPTLPPVGIPAIPSIPSIPPSIDPNNLPDPTDVIPTGVPTVDPSALPTPAGLPTIDPNNLPDSTDVIPTGVPTVNPTALPIPTGLPTGVPTVDPSRLPTPTGIPTIDPSTIPTPTSTPTIPPGGVQQQGRRSSAASATQPVPIAGYATGAKPVDVNADGYLDFPITQHLALSLPTSSTLVLSTITTIDATDGQSIGAVTAIGHDAVPAVQVAGDFLGVGGAGFLAVDEFAGEQNSILTYRTFNGAGIPGWVSHEQVGLGTLGSYDATADLSGDGRADVLSVRMPVIAGSGNSVIAARTSPLGQVAWSRSVEDQATAMIAGALDEVGGLDVVSQGIKVEAGKIPAAVVYRGLSGAAGSDLYVQNVPVQNGGVIGDWFANLSVTGGDLNNDGVVDPIHAINGIPSGDAASGWSAASVSAKDGKIVWSQNGPMNPGTPVAGNLVASAASDIVDVRESVTRTSDSLVIRTLSGADGLPVWTARVLIGGGTERVRSLTVQASNPNATGDLIVTVVQRSGNATRSLIVAVAGATGQVRWIRTN